MGETGTSAESMTNPIPQGASHITSLNLRGLPQVQSPSCWGLHSPKWKGSGTEGLPGFGTSNQGSRVGTTCTMTVFLELWQKSSPKSFVSWR